MNILAYLLPLLVFIVIFGLLNLIFGDKYIIPFAVISFILAVGSKIIHTKYGTSKEKLEIKEEDRNKILRIL